VQVKATTDAPLSTGADTIAIGLIDGEKIAHDVAGGTLQALVDSGEAMPRHGAVAVTHAEGRRFLLVGLGKRDELDGESARRVAAPALARARELGCETLCWEVPHHLSDAVVAGLVEGTVLKAYRFTRYKPAEAGSRSGPQTLIVSAHHDIATAVNRAAVLASAQNRARDLANAPSNDLTPVALAQHAERIAAQFETITVEVLDERAIDALGMGAIAAVAGGSVQPPRVIVLDYAGPGAGEQAPLGLIGKAVTFDSGGLWLKPGTSQKDMKFDMCGGAAVLEAVWALASLQAPVRVRAVVGAVENLPGPEAVKPGDVVRALDGTTIQVDNTDAEGRLVLGDCITHAIRSGCDRLVDIATLTGGVVAALGYVHAGLLGNDEGLAAVVERAGIATGELVWRLPLHREYAEMVKGRYAQITNLTERREAMAITAAEFLHVFAGDTPWAHLDIAGVAWNGKRPYYDRGGTGFGVRLLVEVATQLGGVRP
jgi:leucyl aminopeptidase